MRSQHQLTLGSALEGAWAVGSDEDLDWVGMRLSKVGSRVRHVRNRGRRGGTSRSLLYCGGPQVYGSHFSAAASGGITRDRTGLPVGREWQILAHSQVPKTQGAYIGAQKRS